MNRTTTLFLFVLCCCEAIAQSPAIDSVHRLARQASGREQVERYAEAAFTARNVHADTALYFARKANELAGQFNYAKGRMLAGQALGNVMTVKGQYDLALNYFQQVCELALQQGNDSMLCAGYTGIGVCLWQLGKHAESLENHFRALQLREKINDVKGIITSRSNIGMVYQSQDKLQLAEKYIRESLDLLKTTDMPAMKLNTLHTLANIMGMQGKIAEALAIDAEGIELAERTNNEFTKAMFYDNMANCYLYSTPPDYTRAIEYFRRTLQIDSSFSNKKQMSDSYVNLGTAMQMQHKFAEAIPYFQRSALLARESGFAQGAVKSYGLLAAAYQQSGQPARAYETLLLHNKFRDSLFTITSEAKMAEMETLYQTARKERQIEQQQHRLRLQYFLLIGIAVLVVLAALLVHSFYKRHNLKKEAQLQAAIMRQQELATRAVLEAEENERQRIARDLHDGVGQMMSAAKMNLSAFESGLSFSTEGQRQSFEKAIALVDESCREVRSVSHIMMPNVLLKNGLDTAIRDFTDKLATGALQVHLYTEGLDKPGDSNTEIVLYRVLQECVNNVIRHANATTLDISLVSDREGIRGTIEDNGVGFDITDKTRPEGIGLKNIMSRIQYLKGTLEIDSAPGKGTLIAFFVPHPNES